MRQGALLMARAAVRIHVKVLVQLHLLIKSRAGGGEMRGSISAEQSNLP